MDLSKLEKTAKRNKKRPGRGYGSGKGGHTSGRGAKGAKARGKVRLYFEGASMGASLIKRLPLLRGKEKNKSLKKDPVIVNIKYLNLLPKNSVVDLKTLIKHKIVDEDEAKKYGVKILGEGELKIPLEVNLPCSKSAKKKIEASSKKVSKENKKEEKNQVKSASEKKGRSKSKK